MPLKLVTGPANAAKAGEVLGGFRRRLGDDPVLVVPEFDDVDHVQREMARAGAVLGGAVLRINQLYAEIARRVGESRRVIGGMERRLLVEDTIAGAPLARLRAVASSPGLPDAAMRFFDDLSGAGVDPDRFDRALAAWAREPAAPTHAAELGTLFREYRAALARAGVEDAAGRNASALAALRAEPRAWGSSPVFLYGFDDLAPLDLDAIETLAQAVDVTVSLTWEPGRLAFKGLQAAWGRLDAIADERVRLDARDDHYEPGSRALLHGLERRLFGVADGADEPVPEWTPGVVRLHSAAGARAEIELAAARALELVGEGAAPGDIAIVMRDPAAHGTLIEQVLTAYGLPHAINRSVPLAHTGPGRALLALLRCAFRLEPEDGARDLVEWLRSVVWRPGLVDGLERALRRKGVTEAGTALALARSGEDALPVDWPLEVVSEISALTGGPLALRLDAQLDGILAAPRYAQSSLLGASALDDAAAVAGARDALRGVAQLARADRSLEIGPARLHDLLAGLRVRQGDNPDPGRLRVSGPEGVRARRYRAVIACGLQDGEFPRGGRDDALLSAEERIELAAAGGLRLAARVEEIDRERFLFYLACSRAERELVLSSRVSDEDGRPEGRSFFVDEALDALGRPRDSAADAVRGLGDVAWPLDRAPTPVEWDRARALADGPVPPPAIAPLRDERARAGILERGVSVGALERYAMCPMAWLVEQVLRARDLEADPDYMRRGIAVHDALRTAFERLREGADSVLLGASNRDRALALADEIVDRLEAELAPGAVRALAELGAVRRDLRSYIDYEAGCGGTFEAARLELAFGPREGTPFELEGVPLSGRIDRVDVYRDPAEPDTVRVLVRDYKGSKRADGYAAAKWASEPRLQAALYLEAVAQVLEAQLGAAGVVPAGAVYAAVGVRGDGRRYRGLVASEDAERLGEGALYANDVRERDADEGFDATLAEVLAVARTAAAGIRDGLLAAAPDRCAYPAGGCAHPSFCRAEGAGL